MCTQKILIQGKIHIEITIYFNNVNIVVVEKGRHINYNISQKLVYEL